MKKESKTKHKNQWKAPISRESWLAESIALADKIKMHHGERMIDIDMFLELDKKALDNRFSIWKDE